MRCKPYKPIKHYSHGLFLSAVAWCLCAVAPAQAQHSTVTFTDAGRPTLSSLRILAAEREIDLTDVTRDLTLLANPKAVRTTVWILAFQDSREAATLFRERLSRGYRSSKRVGISSDGEDVLLDCILALGFLSDKDEDSFHFLLSRTDSPTWARAADWESPRKDYSAMMLVGYTIQALGISGRDEAAHVLIGLRDRSPTYLHDFAGDIVQAEFYRFVVKQHGRDGLWRFVMSESGTKDLFVSWSIDEGKDIVEWANGVTRGPRPQE